MADELIYRASRSKAAFVLIASIRGAKMIAIIYAPHYAGQKMGRAVAEHLSGMEGAIPNNYNAPLDELLKTLNEWQVRYSRTA